MKKVYYLFIIALSLVAGSAKSQTDAGAKKILDEVTAKLKTYKGINAGFTLISKSRTGQINNNVNGKIFIKGNKYYIKEGTTEIFSDGNKTWNYNGNDEVTVTAADADDQAFTPQKLLTDFYDKDFSYKLVSSAGNYNQIQLVPVDKRKNFQKINVFVDKSKGMITKAKVIDKSSNTIDFNLKNINTRADIADDTFVFDQKKYNKNIEVIE
ncbi:LolA family protein [Segetibacter koreensis]|uniref:LolA family protein n=1 Tax=Segetibacter koreensis TaxID=398037 RepID=UPI00035FF5EA|nr:outer membrane lipoprotein carrier protein LolA [Segetibacter koreensis]